MRKYGICNIILRMLLRMEMSMLLRRVLELVGVLRPGAGVGMERYRSAYEESMTPFEAFRGKVYPSKSGV